MAQAGARLFFLPLCACLAACAPEPGPVATGPVGAALQEAADESGVPRDLLVAVAIEEGGLRLPPKRVFHDDDHVPVAGYLELRHGAFDSLERAAELAGVSSAVLVEDSELATRAGARVLAELGAQNDAGEALSSWTAALEQLSGLSGPERSAYAQRVLTRLVDGGRFPAYGGELVELRPHRGLRVPSVLRQAVGTPEFPGALWIDTSCAGKCNVGRGGKIVDTIVIHDTEASWNASVATLQNDPGKSVHYLIDADGSRVAQFRPESDITWHSGNSTYNGRSVGIEHVGFIDDPNGFSNALYETSAQLVASVRSRHDVPVDRQHIIGHYQVPDGGQIAATSPPCADQLLSCLSSSQYGGASNHRDPGTRWQWCQYMERLGGHCECADAFMNFNCTTDKTQAVRCQNGVVEIRTCAAPCEVQPIGTPDLCEEPPPSMPPPTPETDFGRLTRRVSLGVEPTPEMPGPVPGTEPSNPAGDDHGCAMSGRRPDGVAWRLGLIALLVGLSYLRRRAT